MWHLPSMILIASCGYLALASMERKHAAVLFVISDFLWIKYVINCVAN